MLLVVDEHVLSEKIRFKGVCLSSSKGALINHEGDCMLPAHVDPEILRAQAMEVGIRLNTEILRSKSFKLLIVRTA